MCKETHLGEHGIKETFGCSFQFPLQDQFETQANLKTGQKDDNHLL